ncbi:MAG: endonuclease/exonuclease/phosphatase family protein [Niabella sp.]|nr:endonuclease/exonuclease/phosphatase family protein [Niabella sp.]
MPFYHYIQTNTAAGKRTLNRLLALRKKLQAEIPAKQLETNLLLATWNIREFDSPAYGMRLTESFYYIAEIIARFDLVAIQEVRDDLRALKYLLKILGGHWSYVVTDITAGNQGNKERLAFVFDTRKVRFGGLAGEMVLPPFEKKDPQTGQTIYESVSQLARTPYTCGFTAGWTNFQLTTVHILYGQDSANNPDRVKEIETIAQTLSKRADGATEWSNNNVLLGDFNIYKPSDMTYAAIVNAGFTIPQELQHLPSNAIKNKFYDQIAFKTRPGLFETTGRAGVFDYYNTVFRPEDETEYIPEMGDAYFKTDAGTPRTNKAAYYKTYWRTHQMSDHLPMWVEISIDHTDAYLSSRLLPPQQQEPPVSENGN